MPSRWIRLFYRTKSAEPIATISADLILPTLAKPIAPTWVIWSNFKRQSFPASRILQKFCTSELTVVLLAVICLVLLSISYCTFNFTFLARSVSAFAVIMCLRNFFRDFETSSEIPSLPSSLPLPLWIELSIHATNSWSKWWCGTGAIVWDLRATVCPYFGQPLKCVQVLSSWTYCTPSLQLVYMWSRWRLRVSPSTVDTCGASMRRLILREAWNRLAFYDIELCRGLPVASLTSVLMTSALKSSLLPKLRSWVFSLCSERPWWCWCSRMQWILSHSSSQ